MIWKIYKLRKRNEFVDMRSGQCAVVITSQYGGGRIVARQSIALLTRLVEQPTSFEHLIQRTSSEHQLLHYYYFVDF